MISSAKRRLFLDIETFSSVDIKEAGAFRYMESPDFEILLIAYAWDNGPVELLDLTDPFYHDSLPDIVDALRDSSVVNLNAPHFISPLVSTAPRKNGRIPWFWPPITVCP